MPLTGYSFKNGYQGGCYACEIVGEKNVELERQNTEYLRAYEKMAKENVRLLDAIRISQETGKSVPKCFA